MSDRDAHQERGLQASPPPGLPGQEPSAAGSGPQADAGASGSTPKGGADASGGAEAELAGRIAELENERLRALADADNARKRCAGQIARAEADTRTRVARMWLPVVDNLERALSHAQADPGSIVEGVQAVWLEAIGVLGQLGFARHEDLGARFDPARHEAIASRPDPAAPDGSVVEVIRPGYGEGDSQLRPAQVVVARAE
jgi:molecular chaperone GrpE